MSGDESSDPLRGLAANIAETNGFLRAYVAGQDQINKTVAATLEKLTTGQAEQGERLAAAEVNAECVPDLYEKIHGARRRSDRIVGGLMAVVVIASFVGPSLGRWIIERITGG
ncbi:MAG: hypothetical protein JRC92_01580 [Deltaproteobacteria bacterium]|nr:hypothetical protein [Deltaproteobacteria bacterium]